MGCCLSSPIPPLSGGTSSDVKSPDPVKPDVNKPTKPVIELPVKPLIELQENPVVEEEAKPIISEKVEKEEENVLPKKRESEEALEKPVVVRTSSCTKEEVDAILIQCGKLSRSNTPAKTRRYSGSKRSFDFDQNERIHGGGGGDAEEAGRKTPQRNRVERVMNNGSPRERRRRTPSRERERERGGGSRRVSRSPAKRSEAATNPRGSLEISSNTKFVTVPATDQSSKRVTTVVKRSIGEACRTAAMSSNIQPPPREQSQSPYRRRKPLREIDQNKTKGDKKMMIKRENESAKITKPQVVSRSRSLRKSRDFDFSPETLLLQSKEEDKSSTYTALLLKDIKNFHGGKSSSHDDDDEDPFSRLPSCVTKACSIVEAVADLNSTSSDLNQFRFTSTATVKKADLMEPSFEKYVTVKRGGCSLEEQESSCASNNLT
ncbi:hypothetical protein HA466_0141660 [Hirschfeldia incana]|nr:hypothetical protein HA466_0141660 [Hirschfeldia incana]